MPAQVTQLPVTPEATYKAREFEGILDLYFYRRIGFWLAQLFARLNFTPSGVTMVGGLFGVAAGHLYYYRDLRLNIIGMLLHICANAFDNADGQLARLTNQSSRRGRITDSVVDHIIFIGIYLHLTLRCVSEGASPAIWILAAAAGASHAVQSAAADYCRNAYLYFAKGRPLADFDTYAGLLADYQKLGWPRRPWEKLFLWFYLNGTREQELLSPGLQKLQQTLRRNFAGNIPRWLQDHYRRSVRPTFKLWGFLMTNTRMILLLFLLIIDRVSWFFWLELTVFNFLLIYLIIHQDNMSRSFLELVRRQEPVA